MKPTAIGQFLLIVPQHCSCGKRTWAVVAFGASGHWKAVAPGFATEAEAQGHRVKMRQLHARLARERAARQAKRGAGVKRAGSAGRPSG